MNTQWHESFPGHFALWVAFSRTRACQFIVWRWIPMYRGVGDA